MFKFRTLFIGFLAALSLSANAQMPHFCSQHTATERLFEEHPEWVPQYRHSAEYLEEFTRNFHEERSGGQEVYIVPIVFHVIHLNGSENISDEQIYNAVSILNRDFNLENADISAVVPAFQGITANCGIRFALAARDPQGNCTKGINRIVSSLTETGTDEVKNLIHWPRDQYLNIYVCMEADGAAGYAYMPASVDNIFMQDLDGIVIKHQYVGNIGTGSNQTSRALTHEVGHYLNLFHTWGPTNSPAQPENCNSSDFVEDTPTTIGHTTCNLSGASCGSDLDNVQNYMEYSYCSRMFTQGQANRMRATLNSGVADRNNLISQSNLVATGVLDPPLCAAAYVADRKTTCVGIPVNFSDGSYHGVTTWTWNFGDGTTLSGSDPAVHQNPSYAFNTPGTYTVTLNVSNGVQNVTSTTNAVITVLASGTNPVPVVEGFENTFPSPNWFIENVNGDISWEQTTSAQYSGAKGLRLRNYNATLLNNSDILYSNTYDMSGADTAYISFKWAYASRVTETSDRFRVSISGDCGEVWFLKRQLNGTGSMQTANAINTAFTPNNVSQWDEDVVMVTEADYLTDNFRVMFEFIGNGGNNFFIDDINITSNANTSGIESLNKDYNLKLFPNPSSNTMELVWNQAGSADFTAVLYDQLGKVVEKVNKTNQPAGELRHTFAHQTAGMYQLVIQYGSQTITRKIVFE
jgi:PKD repeat protein